MWEEIFSIAFTFKQFPIIIGVFSIRSEIDEDLDLSDY
ncbi:hypothetical protein EV05_0493 [Prochlorococcus sp. MIT 0601]|nr:hypothetical protein EV05_0493 [Prochlorococcus sp. MIT 0601]